MGRNGPPEIGRGLGRDPDLTASMQRCLLLAALFSCVLATRPLRAELISLDIQRREPFAGGESFGKTGAYVKLIGVARFAVDPAHARNKAIIDLSLAPRNARGLVEMEADVCTPRTEEPRARQRSASVRPEQPGQQAGPWVFQQQQQRRQRSHHQSPCRQRLSLPTRLHCGLVRLDR